MNITPEQLYEAFLYACIIVQGFIWLITEVRASVIYDFLNRVHSIFAFG